MNYKNLIRGDYIAAAEFGDKEPTLTIASVKLVKLEREDGSQKDRGVIGFRETERGWVLNRTNLELLAAMFGTETDAWIGRRVTLQAANVRLGTETTLGIRVKGSPEIDKPIVATVKLPRRKPARMTLVPTGKGKPAEQPPTEREPGDEG